MNTKKYLLIAFVVVALAQLIIPLQQISNQAKMALSGNEFQFEIKNNYACKPDNIYSGTTVQGRFIWLQFARDTFSIRNKADWESNQVSYVSFVKDSLGNARIGSVSQAKPEGHDWIKTRTARNGKDLSYLRVFYPFSRYYIEDINFQNFEKQLTKKLNDSLTHITLKVKLKDNQFVISDLVIDQTPFKEFVKGLQ